MHSCPCCFRASAIHFASVPKVILLSSAKISYGDTKGEIFAWVHRVIKVIKKWRLSAHAVGLNGLFYLLLAPSLIRIHPADLTNEPKTRKRRPFHDFDKGSERQALWLHRWKTFKSLANPLLATWSFTSLFKKKKKKRNYKLVYHQRIWPLAEEEERETNYSALWSQWIDWEAVNLAFERTCADWKGKVSIRNNPIDKHGS